MGEDITAEDIRGAVVDPEEEGPETLEVEPDGETQDDTDKTEPDPDVEGEEEEAETAKEPEDAELEENAIPQSEFDRHYGKWKSKEREYQEKLDLIRRDPEAYYQRYPDERPETARTTDTTAPAKVPTFSECLQAPITSGQFQGYTLGQLWESDDAQIRAVAVDIYNGFAKEQQRQIDEQQTKQRTQQEQGQAEIQKDHESFYEARAQEFFGKSAQDLSKSEIGKIEGIVDELLDQMEELGAFKLSAAYDLAMKDERLKTAQGKAIKGVIDSVRKGSHVSGPETKPSGSGKADVYDRMMELSEDQVAAKLDGLSSKEQETFWKRAPKEFRSKFRAAADAWV